MKSLHHNGICFPEPYQPLGDLIFTINGAEHLLTSEQEQMILAWTRKIGTPYVDDPIFKKNFFTDFCNSLKIEYTDDFDLSLVAGIINEERTKKGNITKEEKKKLTEERKKLRDLRKSQYRTASLDGVSVEVGNYMAEPSGILMGRALNPMRGHWKPGPIQTDVILNLSPDAPKPAGKWKAIEWHPDEMWIAKWKDKLSGEIKYVWLADSCSLKQEKEQHKFDKAWTLDSKIDDLDELLNKALIDKDEKRKKVATVIWLIKATNMRVGDEKDSDEADTVGATTLRKEHIKIDGDQLTLDFYGKDSVHWKRTVWVTDIVKANLESFMKTAKSEIFEGITSSHVSKFLSEVMEECTAKVFRVWRATKEVKEFLIECPVSSASPDFVKIHFAKEANLRAAMICNHKKKLAAKYPDMLKKKQDRMATLEKKVEEARDDGKEISSIQEQLRKAELSYFLAKDSGEYNLGTSLKAYIDPRVYSEWAKNNDVDLDKIYNKTLKKKFSWAFQ